MIVFSPLGILVISVALIVASIVVLRLHPFFALMIGASSVALLSAANGTNPGRFVKAIDSVMAESGVAMGRLGFAIAMAAVIGTCLFESGAADKIIRRMIALFGVERASIALLLSGFILSAPVFVDTVIMLLLPISRALSLRTNKNYVLNTLALFGGAVISNGTIPPAPGPLFVAEALKLQLGTVVLTGLIFGLVPLLGAYGLSCWFNRRIQIPVRPTSGSTLESLAAIAARSESDLPPFWLSVCPVAVPMLLIAAASLSSVLRAHLSATALQALLFFGNKNVALALGGVIALGIYARFTKTGWRSVGRAMGAPLETAGVIILIIAAGGAYGAMIYQTGVGEQVRGLVGEHSINFVLLGWLVAAILRAAQGSATVATITAVGIMLSISGPSGFGVHPLYILLAIGFGSKFLSWMNDNAFWLISRLGGFTQEETLRTWTPFVSMISLLGLAEVLLVSHWFPTLWL